MNNKYLFRCLLFLFTALPANAQVTTVLNDVRFYESVDETKHKVDAIAESTQLFSFSSPNFPIAAQLETHLVAKQVIVGSDTLDKVVFTFADNRLTYIQAEGEVINGLGNKTKSEQQTYMHYQIYASDLLFIDLDKDMAWLLTEEATHPNLFTWNNPYLSASENKQVVYNPSVKLPEIVKMGRSVEELLPLIQEQGSLVQVEKLKETPSYSQTQVNGFGIEYAGFPRKFEFRFENGKLQKVWILTGKEEEKRLYQDLIQEFGGAIFRNEDWDVFKDWTVLLRKDKPEILLLSDELAQRFKRRYVDEE
ncbi:hypothetical protein [Lutimonas sp.]|uniref:hypothetical protein n=1 Tax=Lutimonas sp. TaxID=1872403 RepID=UPI003D9BCC30